MKRLTFVLCLLLITDSDAAYADGPRYATQVRPILAANCFACHGADENSREADLRLDVPPDHHDQESPAAKAIIPGKPDVSELIQRITTEDPDLKMPPPDSGHSLTRKQVETLTQWIAAGAEYEGHWAFLPPKRAADVSVTNNWCRSPIDEFVLQKLVERELKPAPEADPWMLIRRVYLDLTGLPPTPQAADRFAADPSDAAYEAIVDELLASPRFGEHWASMWLDLARYADTKGYEKDQPRNIWRYRDWVIEAFNRDLPFDQFTTEQIAGDLLANATTDQILATAFHRNTMTNDEGGTDNEEFRIAAVKDRVDTMIQVWMGLTMGCAKCHSHKYDPISQREYYQFMAYFNQTEDADRGDDAPRIPTPTAGQQRQQADLEASLARLREQQAKAAASKEFRTAQRLWEADIAAKPNWEILRVTEATSANGSQLTAQPDQSVLASGDQPATDIYTIVVETDDFRELTAVRIEAMTDKSLPKGGPGRNAGDPNFVLSEFTATLESPDGNDPQPLTFSGAKADYSQNNWQVEKAIDGNSETGWAVSPQFGKPHTAIFVLSSPVKVPSGQQLRLRLSQQYNANSLLLGRVRISVSNADPNSLEPGGQLNEAAALAEKDRTAAQQKMLRDAFLPVHSTTAAIADQISTTRKQLDDLKKEIVSTPIMRDLQKNKQRQTHIHVRGNFLEKGDPVNVGFPTSFADALPQDQHTNRRDVAAFLMSDRNPLTSRVMVNRVWSRLFGRGIVETEEDFGTQGMLPTHPQLLDWLAIEFRQTHAWSFKRLCKTIVLSSTYRQSSAASDRAKTLDPGNHWLSRGPRYRLSAEMIRDQSLAVSGLLSDTIGGPSVMPPQPDGIWKATYSRLKWETATGEDRYRRSLYTFLRRTSPYPSMITFDGTSREVCQIRRIRTNTPLQALVLLNDEAYVEAAGALARSVLDIEPADRLSTMFRRVLIRLPTAVEMTKINGVYADLQERYNDPDEAAKLLEAANQPVDAEQARELACLTMIASVLLNLDETVSRI